jgi:hypothetical protein
MSKENILIIKSGLSGDKLTNLYRTKVDTERGPVKLMGKTRLTGSWYRAAVAAAKAKGIKGTLTVIVHNEEDADELIHEHQRLMIKLGKGVDWTPVARMRMNMNEFGKLDTELFDTGLKQLAEDGFIKFTSKNRYSFVKTPQNNAEINANRLYVKQFIASLSAEALADKVEVI